MRPAVTDAAAPRAACPLCGGDSRPCFTTTDRNRAIGGEVFVYRRCVRCQTIFLANVPVDLGAHYPPDYHELPSLAQLDVAAGREAFKLEMIADHARPGRLVELGAGFGIFARAAQRAGHQVTAVEMSERCCAYLRNVVGVATIRSDDPAAELRHLPPSRVITLWHVLEHLPGPADVLLAIAENLEPGGVLVIAVPNPQALQFRLLRGRWAHVDAPRHLQLIPAAALTERAAELGLRRVKLRTGDPAGRYWNRFGWEYALRRFPARRPPSRLTWFGALAIMVALMPLEASGSRGSAYTAAFVKDTT